MTLHGSLRRMMLATAALSLATGLGVGAALSRPPHDSVASPAAMAAPEVADERLLRDERLRRLYEPRDFQPIWLDEEAAGLNDRGEMVLDRLARSHSEGLEPARYGVEDIERAASA